MTDREDRAISGSYRHRPVFLSGFMGAGKSSVGRLVAERLGCPFVDLDALIEKAFGMSIPEIFSRHGEGEFRRAEARLLVQCADAPSVVALGGGAVMDPVSRRTLLEKGLLVYLRARPETLVRRLQAERTGRPMIDTPESLDERVRELMSSRGPVYELAPIVVDTDDKTVKDVAEAVLQRLRESA